MDLKISNKTALITGAGRGLGHGICHSLAREGVKIIGCSRTKSDLEELSSNLNGEGHNFIDLDLEKHDGPKKLIQFLRKKNISPDIIVNNVGGNLNLTDPLGPLEEWKRVMRLNVEIAIEINREFIPEMRKRKWGRICHISSISALENQGPPSYCAAKSALNAYVRSLGRFVSPENVILTSVMPGAVLTPGGYWDDAIKNRPDHVSKYLNDRMAIKRFGKIEEISELVTFMCSEYSSFCVGTAVLADGGQGRLFYPIEN
tara:strand:+ start:1902 stop:2678 length:777 start_codon:yes stop_codon:yes gene_type:complete